MGVTDVAQVDGRVDSIERRQGSHPLLARLNETHDSTVSGASSPQTGSSYGRHTGFLSHVSTQHKEYHASNLPQRPGKNVFDLESPRIASACCTSWSASTQQEKPDKLDAQYAVSGTQRSALSWRRPLSHDGLKESWNVPVKLRQHSRLRPMNRLHSASRRTMQMRGDGMSVSFASQVLAHLMHTQPELTDSQLLASESQDAAIGMAPWLPMYFYALAPKEFRYLIAGFLLLTALAIMLILMLFVFEGCKVIQLVQLRPRSPSLFGKDNFKDQYSEGNTRCRSVAVKVDLGQSGDQLFDVPGMYTCTVKICRDFWERLGLSFATLALVYAVLLPVAVLVVAVFRACIKPCKVLIKSCHTHVPGSEADPELPSPASSKNWQAGSRVSSVNEAEGQDQQFTEEDHNMGFTADLALAKDAPSFSQPSFTLQSPRQISNSSPSPDPTTGSAMTRPAPSSNFWQPGAQLTDVPRQRTPSPERSIPIRVANLGVKPSYQVGFADPECTSVDGSSYRPTGPASRLGAGAGPLAKPRGAAKVMISPRLLDIRAEESEQS